MTKNSTETIDMGEYSMRETLEAPFVSCIKVHNTEKTLKAAPSMPTTRAASESGSFSVEMQEKKTSVLFQFTKAPRIRGRPKVVSRVQGLQD